MDILSENASWDIFISHASEDKASVAIPIARELQRAGLTVWLDAQELTLGDSLRAKIDEGLGHSRFGAVILSEAFFAKHWPQRELNALVALESKNRKVLLPVLHGINQQQVARFSPILADKLSTSTQRGIQHVAMEIANAIRQSRQTPSDEPPRGQPSLEHCLFRPKELIGTKVGSYLVGDYIGSGGSGAVFRSSHRDLGERLAIKIFYPLGPEYSHFNELFDRGFRALSRLKHPSIVSTKDFGRVDLDGLPVSYLVMDFVAGQSLERWTKALDRTREAFRRRLLVAQQLADAMLLAHESTYVDSVGFQVRGILHADLKPANIIINSSDIPVVLDFLLVDVQRLLDPRIIPGLRCERAKYNTESFGTPGFMAPEQSEQGIVTISTDIFGLGITLCHLFLPDETSPEIAIKWNSGIPQFITELLAEMTAAEPRLRPESMRDVVQRLGLQSQNRWFHKWIPKPRAWLAGRRK